MSGDKDIFFLPGTRRWGKYLSQGISFLLSGKKDVGGGQSDLASTVLSTHSANIFNMPKCGIFGYNVLNLITILTSLYLQGLHEFLYRGISPLSWPYLVRRAPYLASSSISQNSCIYLTVSLPCQPAKLFYFIYLFFF